MLLPDGATCKYGMSDRPVLELCANRPCSQNI